jgi:hypothetical protein
MGNPDEVQSGEKEVYSALDAAEHDGVYQHSLADANSLAGDTEGYASLTGRSWLG